MKIAIPLTAGRLSDHFGHCEQFALIETDPGSKRILAQNLVVPPPHEPGLLPRWLHQQGVQIVIAGGMGRRALDLFAQNGIAVHAGTSGDTPDNVAQAFLNGALGGGTPTCGHDHGPAEHGERSGHSHGPHEGNCHQPSTKAPCCKAGENEFGGFMTKQEILDLYFLDARHKLIEIAAFLDRVERAKGRTDFRLEAFRIALGELTGTDVGLVNRVLGVFSDPTVEPIPVATTKSACGAWHGVTNPIR